MNRDNRSEWLANQYQQAIIDSNNSLSIKSNKKNSNSNQIKINFKPTKGKNLVERVIGWFIR